jgi:Flp pilus assembly protein TadG
MREIFKQRQPIVATPTFLTRLRRDVAGNTLMLVAGAILPLTAMIGAGVDMSRTYLVKSRLQQACDAGALATRQKLGGGDELTTEIKSQGTTFFSNNFDTGLFGTTGTTFTTALDNDKQVTGSASTNVPVSIMGMFGNGDIPISVSCDAKLEVANTDIMFVLDVTGSMSKCPGDGPTVDNCMGGAGSRIEGLRSAVLDFYDVIAGAATSTSQLRFGFVPYAANVNLDGVLNSTDYVTSHNYESAEANMTTAFNKQPTVGAPAVQTDPPLTNVSSATCTDYQSNANYPTLDGNNKNGGGPAPIATTVTTVSGKSFSGTNKKNGDCVRTKSVTTTTYRTVYKFTNWTLKSVNYDVRDFIAGSSVNIATGTPTGFVESSGAYNLVQIAAEPNAGLPSTAAVTWDKCVEERKTVASATFTAQANSTYNPTGAIDMEINTLPTDQDTKWRPALHQLAIARSNNNTVTQSNLGTFVDAAASTNGCPKAATKLKAMTRSEVDTYVNALTIGGSTYHDAGMIWGARMISPTSIFASENATAANGKPIGRHIIFMTDGVMCPRGQAYSIQGYERASRRVMGTSTAPEDCFTNLSTATQDAQLLNQRHKARFLAICEAAKAQNISIWTVAFGTDNPPNLATCANPQQAFNATTTADLKSRFAKIAAKIASLRISR